MRLANRNQVRNKDSPEGTSRSQALVVLLSVSYALFCLWRMPANPIATPDSVGYLGFAPVRTAGYPLFLLRLGPKGATITQPILYAVALAWLGLETLALTSSLLLSAAVFFESILIPDLTNYHASLLTESLFMTALLAFLAAIVRFVRAPSEEAALLAATFAGLASIVRSAGLAFAPVVPVMVLAQWRRLQPSRRTWTMAAASIVLAALVGGERVTARVAKSLRA